MVQDNQLIHEIDMERARTRRIKPPLVQHFERWREEFYLNYNPGPLDEYLAYYHGCSKSNLNTREPRKGDWINYWGEFGYIYAITKEKVRFKITHEYYELDRDMFHGNYETPRGRTVWQF